MEQSETIQQLPFEVLEILVPMKNAVVLGDDLVDWAWRQLDNGVESPSLFVLIDLPKPVGRCDTETHFRRALEELGFRVPADESVEREYLKVIAAKIVNEEIEIDLALSTVHKLVVSPLGHPPDLQTWCYLWEWLYPNETGGFDAELTTSKRTELTIKYALRYLQDVVTEDVVRKQEKDS